MPEKRTYTVACGLPSGVVIRTYTLKQTDGGSIAVPDGPETRLARGDNPGVDADMFDKWLDQNKDSDLVLNGVVFAHRDVPAEALEPLSLPESARG